MGLKAESASPALSLPLRNPGHVGRCLSHVPSDGGLGQGTVVREVQLKQGAMGPGWGGCRLEQSEASRRRMDSSIYPTADTSFLPRLCAP